MHVYFHRLCAHILHHWKMSKKELIMIEPINEDVVQLWSEFCSGKWDMTLSPLEICDTYGMALLDQSENRYLFPELCIDIYRYDTTGALHPPRIVKANMYPPADIRHVKLYLYEVAIDANTTKRYLGPIIQNDLISDVQGILDKYTEQELKGCHVPITWECSAPSILESFRKMPASTIITLLHQYLATQNREVLVDDLQYIMWKIARCTSSA